MAPSLRFRNYLSACRISTAQTAVLLGCARSYVSLIQTGRRQPSLALAVRIERLTAKWDQGPIRVAEWVDHAGHREDAAAGREVRNRGRSTTARTSKKAA